VIFQTIDLVQTIADIVAAILTILNPIVSPMGSLMVLWMDYVLQFFPQNNLIFYIIISALIVTTGAIVNIAWAGDKKPKFLEKAKKLEEKAEKKVKKPREKKVEEIEEEAEKIEEDLEEVEEIEEEAEKIEEDLEEGEEIEEIEGK
jgi:hypothetical protein